MMLSSQMILFFFSSRRRHTRCGRDWSSDVCSSDLRERPEWNLWRDGCPQGETAEQVGVRADRIISELRGIEGDVAIFAHGHFLRVLSARWVHAPPAFGERLALTTASVSVLGREHAAEVLWLWNDVSHLKPT